MRLFPQNRNGNLAGRFQIAPPLSPGLSQTAARKEAPRDGSKYLRGLLNQKVSGGSCAHDCDGEKCGDDADDDNARQQPAAAEHLAHHRRLRRTPSRYERYARAPLGLNLKSFRYSLCVLRGRRKARRGLSGSRAQTASPSAPPTHPSTHPLFSETKPGSRAHNQAPLEEMFLFN
eukprot:COSAG04_NODE_618_length_11896_cov_81.925659_11_plen_175_part_00